jgi:cytochrome c oxidase subunit 4
MNAWLPPRELVWSWLGLLALLLLTVFLAYQPLGRFNSPVSLAIALTKALMVAAIFMELRTRHGLIRAFASAGFFWLGIMLWLTFTDYLTRS